MTDIVERLRKHDGMLGDLVEEAADEIVVLRATLRQMLAIDKMLEDARRVLEGK